MYSGGLTWLKGVPLLLDAFAQVDDPRLRLWITGRGECETLVEAAAQRDPRIVYHGFVDYEEVLALYRRADILVNPHLATPLSARYLFPSKLLEYLATGRPVVALSTPDIAADYGDAVVVVAEETPAALAEGLRRAAGMSYEERRALGARGRAAVARKTWPEQATRIAIFVQHCAPGRAALG
jgi:glycosyltransferase involved in cell wall biosynthesis